MVFGFKLGLVKALEAREQSRRVERLEHFRQLAQQDGQGFGNPGGGMMPHESGTGGRGGFGVPGRGGFGIQNGMIPGRGGFGMPGRGGMIPGQVGTGPFGPIVGPGFGGPGGGGMGFGANGSHADDMTVLGGGGSGSQHADRSFGHGPGSSRRSRSVAPEEHQSHSRRSTHDHGSSRSGRHPSEPPDPHLSGMGRGPQGTPRRGRRSTLSEGRSRRFDSQFG
jgi:ATP-dependent RNA helicase DDX5/DBP2